MFIGVSALSSVSSKDISSSNEEIIDYEVESVDNKEIESVDINTEIITFFSGSCSEYYRTGGLFGNVSIYVSGDNILEIFGIKESNSGSLDIFFKAYPKEVFISRFIGFSWSIAVDFHYVNGIALGNIDWE